MLISMKIVVCIFLLRVSTALDRLILNTLVKTADLIENLKYESMA